MIRNFLIYGWIVLAAWILRLGVGGYMTKLILLIFIVFPIFQLLYICYMMLCIKVEIEELPGQMIQGEKNCFGVKITNRCLLPLAAGRVYVKWENLFTKEVTKEKIDFSILPGNCLSLRCFRTDEHCGLVNFEVTSLHVYDMVCMWRGIKRGRAKGQVLVRPGYNPIEIGRQLPFAVWDSEKEMAESAKKGENTEEIVGIRTYQQGDKIQKVHWKLSSKMDDIMIKEFSAPMDKKNHILVDLYVPHVKEKGYYMDAMLEVLTALGIQMLREEEQPEIFWFDGEALQSRKIKSQEQLWDCMCEILSGQIEKTPQGVAAYVQQIRQDPARVYYVGAGWNRESGGQLGKLALQTQLTAFIVDDYMRWEPQQELMDIYENAKFNIYRVQIETKGETKKNGSRNI